MKTIILFLFSSICFAKEPIKIAVIDSGYYTKFAEFKKCNDVKEMNYTKSKMSDNGSHGHNITHIIAEGLKGLDYCIVPLKAWNGPEYNIDLYTEALLYAYTNKVDIVNISLSGTGKNYLEYFLIKSMLNSGIKVVTAVGNDDFDLDEKGCIIYPACIDNRIKVVGSLDKDRDYSLFSNYGKQVNVWMIGENVSGGGIEMSGTSQATALETVEVAKKMIKDRNK